jgi:hypothetical protein
LTFCRRLGLVAAPARRSERSASSPDWLFPVFHRQHTFPPLQLGSCNARPAWQTGRGVRRRAFSSEEVSGHSPPADVGAPRTARRRAAVGSVAMRAFRIEIIPLVALTQITLQPARNQAGPPTNVTAAIGGHAGQHHRDLQDRHADPADGNAALTISTTTSAGTVNRARSCGC